MTTQISSRIWSSALSQHVGQRVTLAGWLHRLRKLGNLSFLILRDAKGLAQIIVQDPAQVEILAGLNHETVLQIEGLVVAEPQAPSGIEIHQPIIEVLSTSVAPPPLNLFQPAIKAQLPTILDHAPLALRHPHHRAFFSLASASMEGFRHSLRALEFTEVQTPKIVASATEGGA